MELIRLFAVLFCCICVTFADRSPVFLWGATSVAKPSLPLVSTDEFIKLVAPLLNERALFVFFEKNLNNKDFLCTSDDGKSCYPRLQRVDYKTYYAAVENPVEALRTIGGEHFYNSVDNNGKISKNLKTGPGKITFFKFDDERSVDRETNLKLHDSVMASITSRVGKDGFFIYVSSPTTSTVNRQRRQAPRENSDGYIFRHKADLLLYFKSLSVKEGSNPPTALEVTALDVKSENATAMAVTLTSSNGLPITFDIILAGGYYFMKNLRYNNEKLLSSDVYAPTDFSYFCGNLTLSNIPNDKQPVRYTLKWNNLQFQAPFGHTKNESFVFGDAWHCVGFFTGGILSGLLIVALLLTITFVGVCWMMDINTMDRFDDPKGKTITINASE